MDGNSTGPDQSGGCTGVLACERLSLCARARHLTAKAGRHRARFGVAVRFDMWPVVWPLEHLEKSGAALGKPTPVYVYSVRSQALKRKLRKIRPPY